MALSGLEAAIAECGEALAAQLDRHARAEDYARLEAKAQERAVQVASGRCDFKPLPKVFTEPFRAELTVERHNVFVSDDYPGKSWEREFETRHPLSQEPMTCLVRIGKTLKDDVEHGVLTQSHQEVYYRLLQIWGEQGYPLASFHDGSVVTAGIQLSAYELVMRVVGNDSVACYDRVRKLVHDMAAIPIVLENHVDWRGPQREEQFTLLAGMDWQRTKGNESDRSTSKVTILFSTRITEGFLAKYSKILLAKTALALDGDGKRQPKGPFYIPVAALLDSQLSNKSEYSIRLDLLAQTVGARRYKYKSQRKEKFEHTMRMLNGSPLRKDDTDFVLSLELRESDDGTDYVLVARKIPAGDHEKSTRKRLRR